MDKPKILMTYRSLMKVPWSILQYFWPALRDNWSWKPIFGLFESGRFRQVILQYFWPALSDNWCRKTILGLFESHWPFYTGFTVSTYHHHQRLIWVLKNLIMKKIYWSKINKNKVCQIHRLYKGVIKGKILTRNHVLTHFGPIESSIIFDTVKSGWTIIYNFQTFYFFL